MLGGYRMKGNLGGDGERTALNKIQNIKLSSSIKNIFKVYIIFSVVIR